jgi:hypothetical protein
MTGGPERGPDVSQPPYDPAEEQPPWATGSPYEPPPAAPSGYQPYQPYSWQSPQGGSQYPIPPVAPAPRYEPPPVPPYHPPQPRYEPPPYPTQQLPPYQPPPPPVPQTWQPAGYAPPSGWQPDSDGSHRDRDKRPTTLFAVLAVVAVLVIAGVVGTVLVLRDNSSPAAGPSGPATSAATSNDFPSASGVPTTPTTAPTTAPTTRPPLVPSAEQRAVTANAERVLHAIGNRDGTAFCPLVDPADLARLLKEKNISSCRSIVLKSNADAVKYRSFHVIDPSRILVIGRRALIPRTDVTPASFGGVEMRKDRDGAWKFRFYSG